MSKNSKLSKKIGSINYNFLSRNFNEDFLNENLLKLFLVISDIKYISEEELPKLKTLLNDINKTEDIFKKLKKLTLKSKKTILGTHLKRFCLVLESIEKQ